jgi:Xaa-Pro dipeptidase
MTSAAGQQVFTDAEYQRRWDAARQVMAEYEVDLAILHDADTIAYLTGFGGTPTTYQALVVPRDCAPLHVLRYAEEATFRASSWLPEAVFWNDRDDPAEVLAGAVRRVTGGPARFGVETWSPFLSFQRLERLMHLLSPPHLVDLSLPLADQRLVASDEEIVVYRQACAAIAAGLAAGLAAVVEGASERDIAAAIAPALVRAGADTPSVGIIGSGDRLRQVHGGLSDRRLCRGDIIRLEQSNSVNRYWARIMRMLSIGTPPAAARELYERMRAVQDEQMQFLRPGAIPHELDEHVRSGLPRDIWQMQLSGYALAFRERSIIGGEADRFRITWGEYRPLRDRMVFHLYLTVGDISISETVLVTPNGGQRLTTWSLDWIEC